MSSRPDRAPKGAQRGRSPGAFAYMAAETPTKVATVAALRAGRLQLEPLDGGARGDQQRRVQQEAHSPRDDNAPRTAQSGAPGSRSINSRPAHASATLPGLLEAREQHMESVVQAALDSVPESIEATGEVIAGDTDQLGEQLGVDLLVVGSRGYGPLRRVLLGSTAAVLIHHVDYPVLVFPRGAEDPGRSA